ncbi:DUF5995 family protein [Mongoliitalea daihaiensis]|uniref:DUF5995 family protein n=1 Tax=Mongoliitalea daihaiensis TaxID=2782006 RepID=UPI001F479A94|nr:DUF5995 family protein [Mongoliitalea daihaiensis]UJP64916.1 hypothetical protein IPZ59_19345 [Mongoliitalea daihaiensis]
MTTIEEIIKRLDEIILFCKQQQSRIGYFAVLYRQVTVRIKNGIDRQEFEDNPRMEKLDVIFAKRFIDAFDEFSRGKQPTESWRLTFEAANQGNLTVMQHLLLGMNAHINLDLGIAAAQTMNYQNLQLIEADFNYINVVLGELVDDTKTQISRFSPLFKLLVPLAKGKDEILVNFSIKVARQGAWKFSNSYAGSIHKTESIAQRDTAIAKLAQGMIHPGKRISFIMRLVSLTEWKSVPSIIQDLEQIGAS